MKCVNISHPDFKALQNETGIPVFVLSAKVSSWQERTGENRFPTVSEVNGGLSEGELLKQKENLRGEPQKLSAAAKKYYLGNMTNENMDIAEKILRMNREFSLRTIEGESFYVDTEGNRYERVSSVIGSTFTGDPNLYADNARIGSQIHKMVELINVGEDIGEIMAAAPAIPQDVREKLYEDITQFLAGAKKDGSLLLSEMIIGDKTEGIAGTVDMIRIKPNGEVSVIDFKTSMSSTTDNKYIKQFTGNGITRSKKEQHTAQLSAYHRIMERALAVTPVGRTIAPIWLKSEEGIVTDAIIESPIKLDYDETMGNIIANEGTFTIPESETKTTEFANTTQERLKRMIEETRIFVQSKLDQLEQTSPTNKAAHQVRLKRLQEGLQTMDAAEGIADFIVDAYRTFYGDEEENRPSAIKQLENAINKKDAADLAKTLSYANRFLDSYSILDDLHRNLMGERMAALDKSSEDSIMSMLHKTIHARDALRDLIKEKAIPTMASALYKAKSQRIGDKGREILEPMIMRSQKNIVDAAKISDPVKRDKVIAAEERKLDQYQKVFKDATFSEEDLTSMLSDIGEDQSVMEYLLSPLISSSEAPLALFARFVKNKLEDARMAVIDFKFILDKEFNKFKKASGRNQNNPATFNKGMYTDVTNYYYDEESRSIKNTRTVEYVRELDVTAFTKSKAEMLKKYSNDMQKAAGLDERARLEAERIAAKTMANWYRDNYRAKPKEEIDRIINEKKIELATRKITEEEYFLWEERNLTRGDDGSIVRYRGELTEPDASKFQSSLWKNLQKNAPLKEYYDTLLGQHLSIQESLPDNYKPGYRLWSIRKSDMDKLIEGRGRNLITNWWDALKGYQSTETREYGNEAFGVNEIPVHFTQYLEPGEISLDLYQSELMATEMVERYKALTDILPEAELMKEIYRDKKVTAKDAVGRNIVDKAAATLGLEKFIASPNQSNMSKQLEGFIDKIFFDERNIKWSVGGLPLDRIASNMMGASALTTIAADFLKGTANFLQGKIQVAIEAASKEFFNSRDYLQGKLFYDNQIPAMLADFGKVGTESLGGQLILEYDALQGEFLDRLGKNMTGNTLKKAFNTDSLFFTNSLGEHSIQGQALFAILHATKVDDGSGKKVPLLLQYRIDANGRLELKPGTVWSDDDRKDLMNTIHAMNKRLHGVYNEFDKSEAQRYLLGRLTFMYRKFVVPGFKRRFKSIGADQELGGITQGYYMTFYNTVMKDLAKGKWNTLQNWSTYTDFEKTNLIRFFAEAGTVLALMGAVFALKAAGDDNERKPWAYNFFLYQALRLKSEMLFYVSPLDMFRILKSPTALVTQIEAIARWTAQFAHPFEKYQRDSGSAEKGDNKLWVKTNRLFGLSGNNLNPEQAVKTLEMY